MRILPSLLHLQMRSQRRMLRVRLTGQVKLVLMDIVMVVRVLFAVSGRDCTLASIRF